MTDPFADPQNSFETICDPDFVGELFLVTPTEYHAELTTVHGKTAAIDVDAVMLTGSEAGREFQCTRIFAQRLVPMFKKNIGREVNMTLGRLGTVPNQKDKSKNAKPVWVFNTPDDADKAIARAYLAKQPAPADPFATE